MIVIGIDPGSIRCGIGIVKREGARLIHVAHATIVAKEKPLPLRLATIHGAIVRLVTIHAPTVCAVETQFFGKDARAALTLGQARGAAMAAIGAAGLEVAEYAPATVKLSVTKRGNAEKAQVQRMVQAILALDEAPEEDAADALAVAICHALRGNAPSFR